MTGECYFLRETKGGCSCNVRVWDAYQRKHVCRSFKIPSDKIGEG